MKLGDYFYLFSVEVVNPENGEMIKRLEFCDSAELAAEAAKNYEKKLKKNQEIWICPCMMGQSKAFPPDIDCTCVEYYATPYNGCYTKTYIEDIKRSIRGIAPQKGYAKYWPVQKKIDTPYAKKNNNLSSYVFTVTQNDNNYVVMRRAKKAVEDGDIIVPYGRALCRQCWNNVKHCVCKKLPTTFTDTDELIQPAIILLNRKGYFTNYSCEGHNWQRSEAYVSFLVQYKFPIPLPEYWYESGNCIRLHYKNAAKDNENFEQVRERKMREFCEWTKILPIREESFRQPNVAKP